MSQQSAPATAAPGAAGWAQAAAVFLAVLASSLWLLGSAHLARTEAHRAITAHQVLTENHWLVTKLYGQPYQRKPPLHYWLLALSEMALGENTWAWRLPSALAAAALAGLVTLMARRWFGPEAGWPGGLSFLAMIVLWQQNRSADIDSLNTAAAAACSLGVLELTYGPTRRPWMWAIFTGLMLGATLMLKGPAGLPVILGGALGPAIVNKMGRRLARPTLIAGVILGLAIAGAWLLAVKMSGAPRDLSGIHEIAQRLNPTHLPWALLTALEMVAVSLPVSAGVWFATRPAVLARADEDQRLRARAVAAAAVASLVICVLFLLDRVRYDAVMLPLLCPLCGAVGAFWIRGWYSQDQARQLRAVLTVTAVALAAAALVFGLMIGRHSPLGWLVPIAGAVGCGLGICTAIAWCLRLHARAAWELAALLLLTAVPFDAWESRKTEQWSAYSAGMTLRNTVGANTTVVTSEVMWTWPELFYYSRLPVRFLSKKQLEAQDFPPGTVLVLDADEIKAWKKRGWGTFETIRDIPIRKTGFTVARVAPAASQPVGEATAPAAP